ncbi:linker for activation of T-cells family member 1 [Xyrauchen texanus]|uniref:linker for activation of T-cells family member 1 n=1 Tax=Xyrauchen texanus TaxID=154827 RepID=UPI002241A9EF|nr:linker for activation of T-cells family member 1 [Xyrauchen texanus]
MDSTALLSVVGGGLLLSIIFVTSLCADCWGRKQPTSIHQRSSDSSPEHNSISGFGVRLPQSTYTHHLDHQRFPTMPYPLANSLCSPSISAFKMPSCPPSENGSQASYVNQNDSEDELYVEPEDEGAHYITVIPDSPTQQTERPSRTSSQSSGAIYINIETEEGNEDSDSGKIYINFEKEEGNEDYDSRISPALGNQTPVHSCGSIESNPDYVNTDPNQQ